MNKILLFGGLGAITLIVIILVAVSCNRSGNQENQGPATLKYWRATDKKEVFDPLLADYKENAPDTKVEYTQKDPAEYYNDLLDALAGDSGPDVFAIRNDWLPAFKDKIEPAPADVFNKEDFQNNYVEVAAKDLVDDSGILGVPLSVQDLGLIYNATVLDESRCALPPENWNEFIACVKKTTRLRGNYITRGGTALGTANNLDADSAKSQKLATDILSAMMIQSGDQMVAADRTAASFGLPVEKASGGNAYPGTRALDFYTSFAKTNKETYSWNSRMDNAIKAFANQKVAMILGYSETVTAIEQLNPKFTFFAAPLPQIKGSTDPKTTAYYWIEVVSKKSGAKNQAWDLLKFLSSRNNLFTYQSTTNQPPPLKDMIESTSGSARYGSFSTQLAYAQTWYKGKQPEKVYAAFANMIKAVLGGAKTQNAVDSARNTVTKLFQAQK